MKNTLLHSETAAMIRTAVEYANDGMIGRARATILDASHHNDAAAQWAGRTWSTWARFYRLIMKAGESFGMSVMEFMA